MNNFNLSDSNLQPILEKRKQQIIEEIASAYEQLGISLSEVDKVRIRRQISNLEIELKETDNKLTSQTNLSTTTKPKLISNLPERNRFFTGREDVLNQLSELLKSNREVAIKQAIAGLGGIGKTQTAIEFCYRHINNDSNNYQAFLWVKSENEIDFNNSYYELAKLLKLISDKNIAEGMTTKQIVDLVKDWLSNNSCWLMVLDNLEDPSLPKQYLPNNHNGHILMTTRSNALKGYAEIVNLKKMSPNTGLLFLLKRANLANFLDQTTQHNIAQDITLDELLSNISDKDRLVVQEIVKELDGLPLALEQAGAYIQETQCSLSDYLIAYKDLRYNKTILDNDGEDAKDHKSVFTTFKLAFDKVKEKSSIAADLLQVCSMLSPQLIPEEIFTDAGNLLGDELAKVKDNLFEFNKVIKTLLNYSLIERDTNNKSISIHRLVQAVIRELIDNNTKKIWFERLIKALEHLCPSDAEDPKNWPKYQRLLPSTSALFEIDTSYIFLVSKAATLFNEFGVYCDDQALFAQALALYNQSLTIKRHHFGDNHPDTARTLNNIAMVYYSQGNHEQALSLYNQALTIYKHYFGDNHPDVARTLNNIAYVYDNLGNYEQALALYNQALTISNHHFGDNHPYVALTFNNIAGIYGKQGNYDQALALYNQALSIRKHHFGDNHPDVALTLWHLASLYASTSKEIEAIEYYKQALSIFDQFLPSNHPNIIKLLKMYSNLLLKLNRNNEAQPLLTRLESLNLSD